MKKVFEDRILKLADTIEHAPELKKEGVQFDFGTFGTEEACGTNACIAGFAIMQKAKPRGWKAKAKALMNYFRRQPYGHAVNSIVADASDYLGIDDYHSRELFYGYGYNRGPITHRRAAAVLRHFVKTGIIDWNIRKIGGS